MRRDPEVAYAGIGREHEVEQGRLAAGAAALVEHVRHGRGADRPPGEGLGERGLQRGRADLIEQTQQARGLTGERVPPDGEGVEEGVGLGAGGPETIAAAEVVRAVLLGDQRGEVGGVLDALPALVGARMARDFGAAVQEPHLVFGGHEGERAADERVRDRVLVAIEAERGRLAGADGAEEVAGERMLGERQQPGLLLGEGLRDALLAPAGDGPRVGDLGDPAGQLRVVQDLRRHKSVGFAR